MSRRDSNGISDNGKIEWTEEAWRAIEQSLDMQMIEHVKALLCELWKQGRITIECRSMGDAALGAALRAVEQPSVRNLTLALGATYSHEQWMRAQEASNREF